MKSQHQTGWYSKKTQQQQLTTEPKFNFVGETMTEKQIEKYRAYLRDMIENKSKNLTETTDPGMKEFIQGKVEAYTVALDAFEIIISGAV